MTMKSARYALLLSLLATASASMLRGNGRRTSSKIVGGSEAELNSYPYYVQWAHGCSGVLFHDDLVLTAAHCNNVDNAIKRFEVHVGGNGTHESGMSMFATEAHEHPRYNPQFAHVYDFMVLKLPQRIKDIEFAPVNSDPNYPSEGTPLTVVGHGLMGEGHGRENAPTIHREVTIPYIDNCTQYYRQVQPGVQFCAGDMPHGGKDACQGDSGSGIFDKTGLLVGVVSWGIGCARPGRPGVYARVSTIERWLAHMKCQVSEYPPEHCTTLAVNVTVDDYPDEIGLSILDANAPNKPEAVVLPAGSLEATEGQTLQYTFSVPKGRDYVVQVRDTNKDGLCCDYGQGSITITDTASNHQYQLDPNFDTEFASLYLPLVGGPDNALFTPLVALSELATFRKDSKAVKVVFLYGDNPDSVTWKFSERTEDGKLSLIHEDLPNEARLVDEFRRQEVQLTELRAGTYQLTISDTSSSTNPGMVWVRVFSLNKDGTAGALLYQLQGGEAFSFGTFRLG